MNEHIEKLIDDLKEEHGKAWAGELTWLFQALGSATKEETCMGYSDEEGYKTYVCLLNWIEEAVIEKESNE